MRRSPRSTLLFLPLLLAGCAGFGCTRPLAAVVPMAISADGLRLTVPVEAEGRSLTLLVDTGAELSLIASRVLPPSHVQFPTETFEGVGGTTQAALTDVLQMRVGSFGPFIASAADLQFGREDGQPLDGVLGMFTLAGYDIDIDIPHRQLRFYRAVGDCSTDPPAVRPPEFLVRDQAVPLGLFTLRIPVTIDGVALNAELDTGSPYTAVFSSGWRMLGLTKQQLAREPTGKVPGINGLAAVGHVHRLREMHVGGITLRDFNVAMIEQDVFDHTGVDLLLGMDFISRVHLLILNSSRSLVLRVVPAAATPR